MMRYKLAFVILLAFTVSAYAGSKNSFNHASAKHRTLDCNGCHKLTVEKSEVTRFPGHGACASCHNFSDEGLKRPDKFCGICHNGTPQSTYEPALYRFPKPNIPTDFGNAFPHVGHLKPLPAGANVMQPFVAGQSPLCTNCHHMTVDKANFTSDWGHKACFPCHSATPVAKPAFNECATCHVVDGDHFTSIRDSVKAFNHMDHSIDIRSKKKVDLVKYTKPEYLCFDCHSSAANATKLSDIKLPTEQSCNSCHNGKIGLPDPLAMDVLAMIKARE
jgi:hypothetical protein